MKYLEAMIAWNPGTDKIMVGPWPDDTGWSSDYRHTEGACTAILHDLQPDRLLANLFILFNTVTVRDCVPSSAAHWAFLAIDEYRQSIPPDEFGAENSVGPTNMPWQKVVRERKQHRRFGDRRRA
jgi:hypothetical protein